jgi:hypothetical protein
LDLSRVARIEWGYLHLLDGYPASPETLHELLSNNPELFIEFLGLVFQSGEGEKNETSKEDKARAENAYRVLLSWEIIPGTRADRSIDEATLHDWIQKARAMGKAQGKLDVCDIRIGGVLAHAPRETDGSWPCIPVRDAIEEIASDDLASGFEVGIYNLRGAYNKSLEEGGDQERTLAKQYQDWAEACKIEWPRTSLSLRRIAESYTTQAQREDAMRELRF